METKDILVKIIKILIIAVFLTPLVLGPFGINLSEYPKAVFFRSLIEIIFVLYVFLILLNSAYLPKKSILLFSVIIFDVILIISSIAGVNFYRSFFGDMQRGEGIILHLHLLAFFIVLIGLFRKKEDWLWLFRATVIVSGLSSIAAIFEQQAGTLFYSMLINRPAGTLSNPDLFGSYLTLSIFLIIFLLVFEQKKNWKILWIFLLILNFYTLFLSGTKAAWVGLGFGFISIYLLNYKNLSYKKRIYSLLIVLLLSVLILSFPFIITKIHLENNSLSQRVLGLYNPYIGDRLNLWKISLVAFKDRPLLGWGFESFSFVSDKYFKASWDSGVYFDRPHNKLMEILVYSGAIGTISYFLIFFILFYLIFKYAKLWNGYNNKPGIVFGSIISAFFISGFFQNIFGFDHIGTYILFFLVAGFVNNNFSNLPEINFEKFNKRMYTGKIIIFAAVLVFMAFVMYQINIKPTIAAMYFSEYVKYESSDVATALAGYKEGVDRSSLYKEDLVMAFADRSIFLLENSSDRNIGEKVIEGLLEVKPILYQAIAGKDMRPNNMYESLSRIDEWSYIVRKDPIYLDDMKKDLEQAIAFNPNIPIFYRLKGEMEILQDKNSDGEKDIKKSCAMDFFNCNGNEAQADKIIGVAYFKKNDFSDAIKNFQKALDADYNIRKKGLSSQVSGESIFSDPVAQFTDSVALMYYNYFKDFESCKKVYEKEMEVYPEYKDIFQQHLNMITADYDKKK